MTISARVICDSIYDGGPRLTTMVLRYPRFIHAEFLVHRVFSRNASSSRAIPIAKMIQSVIDDPVVPLVYGRNQPGMQAGEELSSMPPIVTDPMASNEECSSPRFNAKVEWLRARDYAVMQARRLSDIGLHKQHTSRLLEAFAHIEVVCTSTDWANFYALRDHEAAQPEIRALAQAMAVAQQASTPQILIPGMWHLPFITDADWLYSPGGTEGGMVLPKISAARCARVSYLKHDGTASSVEEDLALYDRLMAGNPKHASPCEHQARVPADDDYGPLMYSPDSYHRYPSNLREWTQFRKLIPGEAVYDGR